MLPPIKTIRCKSSSAPTRLSDIRCRSGGPAARRSGDSNIFTWRSCSAARRGRLSADTDEAQRRGSGLVGVRSANPEADSVVSPPAPGQRVVRPTAWAALAFGSLASSGSPSAAPLDQIPPIFIISTHVVAHPRGSERDGRRDSLLLCGLAARNSQATTRRGGARPQVPMSQEAVDRGFSVPRARIRRPAAR
jgi:hypothetical protein